MCVGDIVRYIEDPESYRYLVLKITRLSGIEMLCLETGTIAWDVYKAMDCYEVIA